MPTGYTAYIENGEITNGKDFLLKCARGFGACIDYESLDVENKIKHHKEQLEKAYQDLERYKNMTTEEAQKIVDEEYTKRMTDTEKAIGEYYEKKERYDQVKTDIENWNPPTKDHIKLKEFALDQIRISTEYNSIKYYNKELTRPKKSAEEYISDRIISATESIQYHLKNWVEEVKRTNERNKWINDLRDSLK